MDLGWCLVFELFAIILIGSLFRLTTLKVPRDYPVSSWLADPICPFPTILCCIPVFLNYRPLGDCALSINPLPCITVAFIWRVVLFVLGSLPDWNPVLIPVSIHLKLIAGLKSISLQLNFRFIFMSLNYFSIRITAHVLALELLRLSK